MTDRWFMKILRKNLTRWRAILSLLTPAMGVFVTVVQASGQEFSARFPDAAQVTADYPDEAQRYGAFEVLDMVLTADAPKPVSKADYNKLFSYEASYNNLESLHLQSGSQSSAYKDWVGRRDQVINDNVFARSVLAKYRLTGIKAAPGATPAPTPRPIPTYTYTPPVAYSPPPAPAPGLTHQRFLQLMPLAFLSWALMFVVAWLLLRRAGVKSLFSSPPALEAANEVPPLPEALRTIHLPGVKYYLQAFYGLVLDKRTTVTTSAYSTRLPDQVTVFGNTAYITPGQTTVYHTRRRSDTLRMRAPDLRESSWVFTEQSGDRISPGQIITAFARPIKKDFSEFVLAYNHNTGELIRVEQGLDTAHAAFGFLGRFALPATTLVGTIGFAIVLGYVLTSPPPVFMIDSGMSVLFCLLVAGFGSLTMAFFMVNWFRFNLRKKRSAQLLAEYGPQLRQYCEQITPVLRQRLAGK